MLKTIKKKLYFFVATYFRVFAGIQLKKWKPRGIVLTGSSGKTTLLHFVESQLGSRAHYSHHANSAFGVPFDILGLQRKSLRKIEWIKLFLLAPVKAFKKPYAENIYVVEMDCDRPGEGKFLSSFLRPEVTLWLNTGKTHSMNFDRLVSSKAFTDIESAIAYEFGYTIEYTQKLAIINGDIEEEVAERYRANAEVREISVDDLDSYSVSKKGTIFVVKGVAYECNVLLPKDFFYSLMMTQLLCEYLDIPFNSKSELFTLPPGRSSVLRGIKKTTIIDSSYNATPDGMKTILEMFADFEADHKWLVLGDMLELGSREKAEHRNLAEIIMNTPAEKIVLVGPRVMLSTYPELKKHITDPEKIIAFDKPKDALEYIQTNISGGETILFKGARFLEGIIEHLLENKADVAQLCRQEEVWQKRRNEWGL